jgi:peptidoglycan hydrolase CwlO-like protein
VEGEIGMKRSISIIFAAILGFSSLLAGGSMETAYANKLQDLKNQKEEISDERDGLESKIEDAQNKIKQLQGQQAKVRAEIERFDVAINDTTEKIREKNDQIADTKEEIKILQVEIKELEARIAKRNELLKDRARNFQETGGAVSYIDVLLGAKSFSDFIDRVSAVATIMEADQDILKKHTEDKELLEKKKLEVETKLANLESMLTELETLKASLKAQKKEQDKLLATLEIQEEHVHQYVMDMKEEQDILAAQESAIQRAIQMERARLAEIERKRKEEAERIKNSGGSSNESPEAPPVSDGSFTVPASGVFTSGYGHRWGRYHYGIDIANRSAVPILAAADGVVIKSYYSPSYGNAIFIAHSINGQIFTTVYAHLSSRAVDSGAVVSKGQRIGVMGNTGESQGQHLHFEIHKGPWNNSKSNAVNPLNYINL